MATAEIDLLVVDLRHGSLYRKVNPTLFEDVTWASGVGGLLDGLGQWGAGLVDLDLDGDLDLFTTNGVAHILVGQYPVLAVNDGKGQFKDARAGAGPYFSSRRSGRGAAFGDYDNDGDLDIVVNHVDHQATASLLRNDSLKSGSWLGPTARGRRPEDLARCLRRGVRRGRTRESGFTSPPLATCRGTTRGFILGSGKRRESTASRSTGPRGGPRPGSISNRIDIGFSGNHVTDSRLSWGSGAQGLRGSGA